MSRLRRKRRVRPGEAQPRQLKVNPVACQAHGICMELLPERIAADPWGYPIVAAGPVDDELLPLAQRAVNSCPTLALLLVSPPPPGPQAPDLQPASPPVSGPEPPGPEAADPA